MHIAGGVLTGVAASYAGVMLWQGRSDSYSISARVLGSLAGFEIVSGVMLAIVSSTISAASLCANIALYLFIVASVEAFLFIRMKKNAISFPLSESLSPVLASLVFLLVALAYGF